jgi:hypothetical protein
MSKLWTKCDSDLISHGQWATRDYSACLQPRGHHYRAIVLHPNRFRHCPLSHFLWTASLFPPTATVSVCTKKCRQQPSLGGSLHPHSPKK